MRDHFTVFVPGQPVPQGSKTAYVNKSTGRPVITDKDVRLPAWRMKITAHALDIVQHHSVALDYPLEGSIGVRVDFVMPRPKGHYGSGKNASILKPGAPKFPSTMPDIDKLLRAVFDAITDAQVWRDDGQVAWVKATKSYVGPSWPDGIGVHITLGVLD